MPTRPVSGAPRRSIRFPSSEIVPDRTSPRWSASQSFASWDLGPIYGVTDLDGTQPHFPNYRREVMQAGKPADDTGYR